VFNAPQQTLELLPTSRTLSARRVSVGSCPFLPTKYVTGQVSTLAAGSGRTVFGAPSNRSRTDCMVKKAIRGGSSVYDSFQAMIFSTNDWFLQPQTIDLDDIDSTIVQTYPGGLTAFSDGWKESMAAFGLRGGQIVRPTTTLYRDTILTTETYNITAASMAAMGFSGFGDTVVPGGEFGASIAHNCIEALDSAAANRCRLTVGFEEPIDTIVLMYAQTQLSRIASQPIVSTYLSNISLKCQ
jgi:hypothetical protein